VISFAGLDCSALSPIGRGMVGHANGHIKALLSMHIFTHLIRQNQIEQELHCEVDGDAAQLD
jgi:hypothetical protein